jgi:hypothetical protein
VQHNGNTVNRVQQGLQQVVSWSAGMDVNWAPTNRISFSTGYVHESNFQKQRSSVENPLDPSLDWLSDSTDTVDTFHGSIKATILPQKLDFNFNGSYSYALGRVEQYSPTVTGNLIYSNLQPNGTQRVRDPDLPPRRPDELLGPDRRRHPHVQVRVAPFPGRAGSPHRPGKDTAWPRGSCPTGAPDGPRPPGPLDPLSF